jgi:hypothetical protein
MKRTSSAAYALSKTPDLWLLMDKMFGNWNYVRKLNVWTKEHYKVTAGKFVGMLLTSKRI